MCNDCVRTERAQRAQRLKDRPPQKVALAHVSDCALRHANLDRHLFNWYINERVYEKNEQDRIKAWEAIGPVYAYGRVDITKAVDDCLKVIKRLNELGYKYVPAIGKVASQKEIDEYLHFKDET